VFTARYALSPYIKQIRFVFEGLIGGRWRCGEIHAPASLPLRKSPSAHSVGRCLGPTAGLDVSEKRELCFRAESRNHESAVVKNPLRSHYTHWANTAFLLCLLDNSRRQQQKSVMVVLWSRRRKERLKVQRRTRWDHLAAPRGVFRPLVCSA
jgi:hypothetical protein